jgi:hypothetical protein
MTNQVGRNEDEKTLTVETVPRVEHARRDAEEEE